MICPVSLNIPLPLEPFKHYGQIESSLLYLTSCYLRDRYNHIISSSLSSSDLITKYYDDNIEAYNITNKDDVNHYIINNKSLFILPILTLQVNGRKHTVTITYPDGYNIMSECIYYNISRKIYRIVSYYDSIPINNILIHDNDIIIKSIQLLSLSMEFLQADIHLDYDTQYRLLSDDAYCFGAQGKDNVSLLQRDNTLTTGNSYSVPYPIIVDTINNCITLDFNAYPADEPNVINKGTDIMYVDLDNMKIQRIDTLRHTLSQPSWVMKHFSEQK